MIEIRTSLCIDESMTLNFLIFIVFLFLILCKPYQLLLWKLNGISLSGYSRRDLNFVNSTRLLI